MNLTKTSRVVGLVIALAGTTVSGGALDPDCDAKKAARSTAMKTTVGVGGRCSPKEAVADSAKDAVGMEEKGPVEKRRDDDGMTKKAVKKARD